MRSNSTYFCFASFVVVAAAVVVDVGFCTQALRIGLDIHLMCRNSSFLKLTVHTQMEYYPLFFLFLYLTF